MGRNETGGLLLTKGEPPFNSTHKVATVFTPPSLISELAMWERGTFAIPSLIEHTNS